MKALILSCNCGEGHNSAGKALAEQFAHRGIPFALQDTLSFDSERTSRFIGNVHTKCALYAPRLFAVGNQLAERERHTEKPSVCYRANATYADKLYHYICENGFDTIVMPHVFPAEALTCIRRRYPQTRLTTCFIATDYACAPFLNETDVDFYCIPHELLRPNFMESGVPADRIAATGIPVRERFLSRVGKAEARARLSLPGTGQILLVMTGSMGYGNVSELLAALRARIPNAEVLVMGGNNERLKHSLREEFAEDPQVRVLDYTDAVSLYMDAADLLFTKPGGLSSTEAAVKGIPMIHTAPIPGWEADNAAFFASLGLSRTADTPKMQAEQAAQLLASPAAMARMCAWQHKEINPNAAADICTLLTQRKGENCLREGIV